MIPRGRKTDMDDMPNDPKTPHHLPMKLDGTIEWRCPKCGFENKTIFEREVRVRDECLSCHGEFVLKPYLEQMQ